MRDEQRSVHEPPVSILLSTPWIGGAGGVERYAHGAIHAISKTSAEFVVVYREEMRGGWADIPGTVDTLSERRLRQSRSRRTSAWVLRSAADRRIARRLRSDFDLHLALAKSPGITNLVSARRRLINPSGKPVGPGTLPRFHAVAAQAPSNREFLADANSTILLPPPVGPLPPPVPPEVAIPSEFLLTVFNPYSPVKGVEELAEIVDALATQIVWCHSTQTIDFDIPSRLVGHSNVIHVNDPTPAQMRWLYERTSAYISFSRSEGFGWSIADALRYSPRVIARETGVMSYPEVRDLGGVSTYSSPKEMLDLLSQNPSVVPRDLGWLSPEAFAENILGLARGLETDSGASSGAQ